MLEVLELDGTVEADDRLELRHLPVLGLGLDGDAAGGGESLRDPGDRDRLLPGEAEGVAGRPRLVREGDVGERLRDLVA